MKNLIRSVFFFFSVAFIACDPADTILPNEPAIDNRLISKEEAISIAENFIFENMVSGRTNEEKPKLKIHELKGKHGKNAVYIVNNDAGGWQIIAGTKVNLPVLAHGVNMSFNTDTTQLNPGLKWWLSNTIYDMEMAYKTAPPIDDPIDPDVEDPIDCDDIITNVEPLVVDANDDDAWFDQHFPENLYYKDCGGGENAPAGCVPIAMAQVMWYYQSPSWYDWSLIPRWPTSASSSASQVETGAFVWSIKESLEPWIDVNCYGTGALTSTFDNLNKSFNEFGYDSYEFTSSYTLTTELNWDRPVIAVGGVTLEGSRHAWVIDGYKKYYMCNSGSTYLLLHCNWGWGPNGANGFYGISGFNPVGYDFNHNLKYHKVIKR